jgi:DNA ligase-1
MASEQLQREEHHFRELPAGNHALRWHGPTERTIPVGSCVRFHRMAPLRPELVVEIAFSDAQASSRHADRLALRFARVKRYRTDETASEADAIERMRQIHAARLRPGR